MNTHIVIQPTIKNYLEVTAEMGMILGLPNMLVGKLEKGRLKSIYSRLQKGIIKEFRKFPRLTKQEVKHIENKILDFAQKSGWEKQQIDVIVLFSFILGLIDESSYNYPENIVQEINNALEFTTQGLDDYTEYTQLAERALKTWRNTVCEKRE